MKFHATYSAFDAMNNLKYLLFNHTDIDSPYTKQTIIRQFPNL